MIELGYSGTAIWGYWQKFLNDAGAHASFQDRPSVPVRARVEWERDGEEWRVGNALWLDAVRRSFWSSMTGDARSLGLLPDDVQWAGK